MVARVVAQRGSHVIAVLPRETRLIGLAVDIGTTKLAAYLVDLEKGHTVAKVGAMNPQIAYGEDVVSRIAYCNQHADGRATLQRKLIETLNTLMGEMCREANVTRDQIVEAVIVGNTAMHHLFAGLPVHQLGTSPYRRGHQRRAGSARQRPRVGDRPRRVDLSAAEYCRFCRR